MQKSILKYHLEKILLLKKSEGMEHLGIHGNLSITFFLIEAMERPQYFALLNKLFKLPLYGQHHIHKDICSL